MRSEHVAGWCPLLLGVSIMTASFWLLLPASAHAEEKILRTLGGLFSPGGYFFTHGSALNNLGSPKFYGDVRFFGRPAERGGYSLHGGIQIIGASDHFLPFSGGNEFTLYGAGFLVAPSHQLGKLRPYFNGGLYAGRWHSDRIRQSKTDFAPSAAVGVEYPLNKFFWLAADYRITKKIGGIRLDGFSISIRTK
jgi:hypothetical protein